MQSNDNLIELFHAIGLFSDEKAFETLFRKQFARLHKFSMQYVHNSEQAEEVVNDVFVKLWKYRQSLQTIANSESYLFAAVKNQSLNYIKKFSTLRISLNSEKNLSVLEYKSTAEDDLEWKSLVIQLNSVVDNLPEQCRKIFKLVREEGFKPAEVAKVLNLSVRTVETQLYRATKRLDETIFISRKKKKARKGLSPDALMLALLAGSYFFC
jgi:RNA polymerase sigma-70 factor (family 1)